MNSQVALYARVSSAKQALLNTIESQIAAILKRISEDGLKIVDENKFIDNGYSGSNLIRPELERMRDHISFGNIDKLYVHSPDRLSRKHAYQMLLLEEFENPPKIAPLCSVASQVLLFCPNSHLRTYLSISYYL